MKVTEGTIFFVGVVLFALHNCHAHQSITPVTPIWSDFKVCIVSKGSNPSDIVEYLSDEYAKYTKLNYQWNLIHERKYPLGYFTVRNAGDVQAAVRCATEHWVRIVAKGGGHSYEEYSFGDNRTFIVDLRHMFEMYVSPDRQWFTIGAGALLGQLAYPLLEQYNLITPHGTCPTVGITGLATGGGYGYMSKLFGLTTDNILEVEMVDAEGSLLIVNEQTYPDLFWALRGAGWGSYGIITKLKFRAYQAPVLVTAGELTFPLSQFAQVFITWQHLVRDYLSSRDSNTKLTIKNGTVIVEVFDIQVSDDNEEEAIQRVQHILNKFPVTSLNTTSVIADRYMDFMFRTSHPNDIGIEDPSQLPNVTREMFTRQFSNLIEVEDASTLYNLLVETQGEITDIIIEMYAFGGAINDKTPLETSFNHRSGVGYMVQAFFNGQATLNPYLPSLDWLARFYELTKVIFRHTESYQNYVDATLPDYLDRYYGSDLETLRRIKRKYDRRNIFYHPQSIPVL
ncbi:uncharacterized FAD-linked oxidoreductase YgaK [Folsomia candida]|uniref:Reticuline oxidase n=1 Tax=Folsomia candida TaxID=158441 RepID=A0A226D5I3_FOLCA|nr:uncharacterized FAD-linked oxidoreductase YgaK [Folsomia candida]OXA40330.1 Reticuline oxidase [Folsomia candida]